MCDTITIPVEEYENLCNDSYMLEVLKSCGVDNWCGYEDAMELYAEEREEY